MKSVLIQNLSEEERAPGPRLDKTQRNDELSNRDQITRQPRIFLFPQPQIDFFFFNFFNLQGPRYCTNTPGNKLDTRRAGFCCSHARKLLLD